MNLRWILLIAGAVLIAAIYIWDRRNRRTQPSDRMSSHPVAAPAHAGRGAAHVAEADVPELGESVVLHARKTERPLTITSRESALDTDGLPPMHADVAPLGSDATPYATRSDASNVPPRDSQFSGLDSGPFTATPALRARSIQAPRDFDGESMEAPSVIPETATPHAAAVPPASRLQPKKTPSSRKIVALRLSAGNERIEGGRLKLLLENAGLRHGRYNIYHRLHSDDTPLFSVASMVEPGTFDPYAMSGVQFPGVTIFAQLPAVIDGGDVFERMLTCARELEQGIGGLLQDERGMPLTAQRAQRLRDDVADFMHLLGQG